jgi:hypothetical protein
MTIKLAMVAVMYGVVLLAPKLFPAIKAKSAPRG